MDLTHAVVYGRDGGRSRRWRFRLKSLGKFSLGHFSKNDFVGRNRVLDVMKNSFSILLAGEFIEYGKEKLF